jgi:transposase
MDFNREDVRKLIYYCWKRGLSTRDIEKEINNTLGEGTVSIRTCYEWVAKFKAEDFDVKDNARSGRPSCDIDDQIQAILDENHHATVREIAFELQVGRETVRIHLLKIGKRYLSTVWIPQFLTDAQKEKKSGYVQNTSGNV